MPLTAAAAEAKADGYQRCRDAGGKPNDGIVLGTIREDGTNIDATISGVAVVTRRLPNGGQMRTPLVCGRTGAEVQQISDAKERGLAAAKARLGRPITKRDPRRLEIAPKN